MKPKRLVLACAIAVLASLPVAADDAAAKAKNDAILEANRKNQAANEIVARTFLAGNAAFEAGNYDEAIKQYGEGLAAEPEQSPLWLNQALALKARGVQRYNAAVATAAPDKRPAQEDFRAAAEASGKALGLVKAAPPDPARRLAALKVRIEAMRLFVTKVDPAKKDDARAAYREYLAAETDAAKKTAARRDLARMLFELSELADARAEYQAILKDNPEDLDALGNLGTIFYSLGAMDEGEGKGTEARLKYQAAADFLQKFADRAPANSPLKSDALVMLDDLRDRVKVKPNGPVSPRK